jgi:hypothetical protein
MSPEALKKQWAARLQPLVGRTIIGVRYMTPQDQEASMWSESAVILILDDGTELYPSADDEGNGPGALFIIKGKLTQDLPDGGAPVI